MRVIDTPLPEVKLLEPRVFGDSRGFFMESHQQQRYAEAGIPGPFVQDNHSRSMGGVLRGLHYQLRRPQGKLVRVSRGVVFDVAVDIRQGSPHFGQWYGVVLSDTNHWQLWVPPGFAHGFCVLSETADFEYKCTDYYQPDDDYGLRWDCPEIGIDWPLGRPVLSEKDQAHPDLRSAPAEHLPRYRPE